MLPNHHHQPRSRIRSQQGGSERPGGWREWTLRLERQPTTSTNFGGRDFIFLPVQCRTDLRRKMYMDKLVDAIKKTHNRVCMCVWAWTGAKEGVYLLFPPECSSSHEMTEADMPSGCESYLYLSGSDLSCTMNKSSHCCKNEIRI